MSLLRLVIKGLGSILGTVWVSQIISCHTVRTLRKPTEGPRGEEPRLASNDMSKLGSGSSEVCQKNVWINLKPDLQAPVDI